MAPHNTRNPPYSIALRYGSAFALFICLTAVLFSHRWWSVDPFAVYSMPDVDTDGTLWFIWIKAYSGKIFSSMELTPLLSYPYGFDLSPFPFDNLIDDLRSAAIRWSDGGWQAAVFVINASALIAYPLSAATMYMLCWHLTQRQLASLAGAIVFGFSGYFIMLSRGSMANNHFWLLPLVYLCFIRYCESGRWHQLLFSCILTGLQFRINPYWAFYGWLFTPVFLVFAQKSWKSKAIGFIQYSLLSGLFLFILNIQFIQQQWYLITNPVMAGLVRPPGEVLSAIFEQGAPFMPGVMPKIYPFFAPMDVGAFLGYSLLLLLTAACCRKESWSHPAFKPALLCFAGAITLSSYVPALTGFNFLYFVFFDMFRGVSRVIQMASFFAGLLVAIYVASCRQRTSWIVAGLAVFLTWYLAETYPGSPTIRQKTDFSQVAKVYESLAEDTRVTAIASYPMTYYNQRWGTAPLFEVIGQVVHQKPLAGAKDLRLFQWDPEARPLFGDIADPRTIDVLASHGINRIVIYNRLMDNARQLHQTLSSDPRLTSLGRHFLDEKDCGVSLTCRSLDISIYEINGVKALKEIPAPIGSIHTTQRLGEK
ncbi:YfhO family protein [Acidovorax sp. NCPPB 4044]|nr:YfhO family protein [Acidovorax sp. NCPPB 4044]